MMNTTCPACLPPANDGCATCGGSWEVTRDVADAFLQHQAEQNELFAFQAAVTDAAMLATSLEDAYIAVQNVLGYN
jgi:hypothetical protein